MFCLFEVNFLCAAVQSLAPFVFAVLWNSPALTVVFCAGVHEGFTQALEPPHSDLFLFPDESGNISQEPSPTFTPYHHPLIYAAMSDAAPESDDFCILETPLAGAAVRNACKISLMYFLCLCKWNCREIWMPQDKH